MAALRTLREAENGGHELGERSGERGGKRLSALEHVHGADVTRAKERTYLWCTSKDAAQERQN